MPATVREVLLTRAARLPGPARRLLRAAAVLGRAVPHELLAAVADPADLHAGLPAAVAHRLLEAHGDGYLLRHPLIQETMYADLLPAVRRDLHARAAGFLAAASPAVTLTELAGHAVQVAYHWRAPPPARRWRSAGRAYLTAPRRMRPRRRWPVRVCAQGVAYGTGAADVAGIICRADGADRRGSLHGR